MNYTITATGKPYIPQFGDMITTPIKEEKKVVWSKGNRILSFYKDTLYKHNHECIPLHLTKIELTGISFNSLISLFKGKMSFIVTKTDEFLIYDGGDKPYKQYKDESLESFFLRVALESDILSLLR